MNKLATVVFENLLAHLFFKVYRSFNCDPPQDFSHFGDDTRTTYIHMVRQKKQELTRNDRVRIFLIKNFLCFRQHGRNKSLSASKYKHA